MKIYSSRRYALYIPGCLPAELNNIHQLGRTLGVTTEQGIAALYDELEAKGYAVRGGFRVRVVAN